MLGDTFRLFGDHDVIKKVYNRIIKIAINCRY